MRAERQSNVGAEEKKRQSVRKAEHTSKHHGEQQTQRYIYLGHEKRQDSIMTQTLEEITSGTRGRGRPKKPVKQWTGLHLADINNICRDMNKWRSMAVNLSKAGGP